MKAFKIPSLILAAVLQLLPIARIAAVWQQPVAPLWAIILRWAGSAAAALGSVQAVSGASTVITNPLAARGTNGIPFKQFRLTTAPDQAHYWTASGLPAGITLTGKSGQTFWALGGTPTVSGVFNVRVTAKDQISSGSDRTISGTLVITIVATGTAPTITTQPVPQTAVSGNPVTFTVSANGTAPLSYQWRKNGLNLSGGNSSSFSLPSVSTSDAGSYTVLVSNSAGSVTSDPAILTVTPPVVPPTITSDPVSQTVIEGATVNFTVTASGTDPLRYQWKKDAQDIVSATAATLTLTNVTTAASGDYSVQVSNSAGGVLSQPATLLVKPAVIETAPTIVTQPSPFTVHAGQKASLSIVATGSEPLTYKWFKGVSEIPDATSSTLVLANADASTEGDYSVEVSNSVNKVHSATATVTVTTLKILSVVEQGDSTVVSWNGLPGTQYIIQSLNAIGGAWETVSSDAPTVEPGQMSLTLPNGSNQSHFFRIGTYP